MPYVPFKVEKVIDSISRYMGFEYGKNQKLLTLTSWNHRPAKLDIRVWTKDMTRPLGGMTLEPYEARRLANALNEYIAEEDRKAQEYRDQFIEAAMSGVSPSDRVAPPSPSFDGKDPAAPEE